MNMTWKKMLMKLLKVNQTIWKVIQTLTLKKAKVMMQMVESINGENDSEVEKSDNVALSKISKHF